MMRPANNKELKRLITGRQGFTLVEMIVTFLLLVIFMGCTVAIIGSSLKEYSRNVSMARAVSVSDALLTEVETQVSRASSDLELTDNAISFLNEDMTREIIYIRNGGETYGEPYDVNEDINDETSEYNFGSLLIHYEQGIGLPEGDSGKVDWYYSEKDYLKNKITAFSVSDISVDPGRPIIKIEMELTNDYGYKYKESRIVKCYSSLTVKKPARITCDCE